MHTGAGASTASGRIPLLSTLDAPADCTEQCEHKTSASTTSRCNQNLTPFAWNVLLLCAGSTASLAAFHALKAVPFAAPTSPFIEFMIS